MISPVSSIKTLDVLFKAGVSGYVISDHILGEGEFGELDDVGLAVLLPLVDEDQEVEDLGRGVADVGLLAGCLEEHFRDLFVAPGFDTAYVVGDALVVHVCDHETGQVRGVDYICVDRLFAQEGDFAFVDHGHEDLGNVVEVACGAEDHPVQAALLQHALEGGFCGQHGDVGMALHLDHGDVDEGLHFGASGFLQEVQVGAVVYVLVGEGSVAAGEAHGGDDDVHAVAYALQLFGLLEVGFHGGVAFLAVFGFADGAADGGDCVALPYKFAEDI